VKSQKGKVDFEIHTLPIIKNMVKVNKAIGNSFKLLDGYAAETSGGLLLCLPAENADVSEVVFVFFAEFFTVFFRLTLQMPTEIHQGATRA
jgi:hypothetical protein